MEGPCFVYLLPYALCAICCKIGKNISWCFKGIHPTAPLPNNTHALAEKHGHISPANPHRFSAFCAGQRYSSRASGLNQSDLLSSGGSVGQLAAGGGGGGVYLPDYSVRQLTDLQIIKVGKMNGRICNKETCWREFSLCS